MKARHINIALSICWALCVPRNSAAQQPDWPASTPNPASARGAYYANVVRQTMGAATPSAPAASPTYSGIFQQSQLVQQPMKSSQNVSTVATPATPQPMVAPPSQNPLPRSPIHYDRGRYAATLATLNQPTLAPPQVNSTPTISVGQIPNMTVNAPTSAPIPPTGYGPALSFPADVAMPPATWEGIGFVGGAPVAATPGYSPAFNPAATTTTPWPNAAPQINPYANYTPPYDAGTFAPQTTAPADAFDPNVGAAPAMSGGCPTCGPWFASLSGLIMTRDVPNNVGLASFNGEPQISVLNTEEAGMEWDGGFEARVGRMLGNRWAAEVVYWMLDPSESFISVRSLNDDITSRLDFDELPALDTIFFNSREQQLYRYNSFQNIEINLLQQALVVDPAGRFGLSYMAGVRYFRFEEVLNYKALAGGHEFSEQNSDFMTHYDIHMHNKFIGVQTGARAHLFLGNRLRAYAMPRVGIMSNTISQRQIVCLLVDLNDRKSDIAMLGQLDLGMSYQLFNCCSIYGGYRVLGIAGVANADDQIARTLGSLPDMASINSSGSLILHGATAGVQIQF